MRESFIALLAVGCGDLRMFLSNSYVNMHVQITNYGSVWLRGVFAECPNRVRVCCRKNMWCF